MLQLIDIDMVDLHKYIVDRDDENLAGILELRRVDV